MALTEAPFDEPIVGQGKRVTQLWWDFFALVSRLLSTIVTSFIGLFDTPNSYTGEGGKLLRVKTSDDGIEFITTVNLITGTANEVEVLDNGDGTITIGLPDDVIITNNLTVWNDLNVGNDATVGNNIYVSEDKKVFYDN